MPYSIPIRRCNVNEIVTPNKLLYFGALWSRAHVSYVLDLGYLRHEKFLLDGQDVDWKFAYFLFVTYTLKAYFFLKNYVKFATDKN